MMSKFGVYRFDHFPSFASIEPANYCMLHCPQCIVGTNGTAEKQTMTIDLYNNLLNQLKKHIHTLIFHFQGEPLLNNLLAEMIAQATQQNIYTMLSTNGLLMTEEIAERLVNSGLDRIIISIDGVSQSAYRTYRVGGDINKAISAVGMLNEARKKLHASNPVIEIQCLRLKSNEHEWKQMKQLYRKWGADKLTFKTAQFYNYENGNEQMPTDNRYCRYKKGADGKYHRKKPYYNNCYRLWSGVVIDVTGNVLPCCFDKNRNYILGNIQKDDFSTIWNSAEAVKFRKHILSARTKIEICRNCTE